MTDKTEKDNTPETNSYDDQAIRKVRDLLQSSPNTIGPYRILEKLGAGGMGEVYRCEQRQPIRREVAIKLIKLGMDTKQVIARFSAERQALAMMDHPNIAKVFDAGTDETGRPYFVMEYVKGKPITEYADDKQLSLDDRLQLFQQVCHAIQHAHHKGVIHRDLKPSNVLVSTQDGRPHAKVIDFGIAKAMHRPLTDLTLFTEHALLIGTPAYMSPEQAEGSIDIDTRSDVYSLGVLLYELLTGHTPFDPIRLKKAAMMEVARIIREEEPPKPSTKISALTPLARESSSGRGAGGEGSSKSSLTSLAKARALAPESYAKQLRGELDWIVMKTLEKDRKRRYSSPEDLAQDIERHLEGVPIEAAPPDIKYRTQKFIKKHKAALVGASVVVSLLVLALAGTSIGLIQARVAVSREQAAKAEETKARQDAEFQAYVANIGAAQVAMEAESWPEARRRLLACPENLRGWEWQYFTTKASAPEYGFPDFIDEVKLSSNDRFLLCQKYLDSSVIDLSTRRRISSFLGKHVKSKSGSEEYWEIPAAVLPDGRSVYCSGNDLVIVGADSTQPPHSIPLDEELIPNSLSVSPQGKFVVVGFFKSPKRRVFNTDSFSETKKLNLRKDNSIEWSANDRFISAIESDESVSLFSTETGQVVGSFNIPGKIVQSTCLNADGSKLAIGTTSGTIELFETGSGTRVGSLDIPGLYNESKSIQRLSFSPDGTALLAIFNEYYSMSIVDIDTMRKLATRRHFQDPKNITRFNAARFTKDGNNIVNIHDGSIWDWQLDRRSKALSRPFSSANVVAFSTDASFAISLDRSRVRVWMKDKPNLQPLVASFYPEEENDGIGCGKFGNREFYLSEWSPLVVDAVQAIVDNDLHSQIGIHTLAKNARWTVIAEEGNGAVVADTKSDRRVAHLRGHEGPLKAAAFSPDGLRLVTGSDDYTVRFWNTETWQEIAVSRHSSGVTDLAFTKDGTRLVVGFADKSVESWDIRSPEQRTFGLDSAPERASEAEKIVDDLLAKQIAWKDFATVILSDPELSPALKMCALGELNQRLQSIKGMARQRLLFLKDELYFKSNVEQRMRSVEIPPLVRKAMENELLGWTETDADLIKLSREISKQTDDRTNHGHIGIHINERLIKDDPNSFEAWKNLGIARYRLGEFEPAKEALTKAIELGERQLQDLVQITPVLAFRAMATFHLGDKPSATNQLKTSLQNFGLIDYDHLRAEAIALIDSTLGNPSVNTLRVLESETLSAIDAKDGAKLDTLRGEHIDVVGVATGYSITVERNAFTVYIDNQAFSIHVKTPVSGLVNDAAIKELLEKKVLIKGRLARWNGMPQIYIEDWAQVAIVASKEEFEVWKKTQIVDDSASPILHEIAPSVAEIRESIGQDKTIVFRIAATGGNNNVYLNSLKDFRNPECLTVKVLADQIPVFKSLGIEVPRIELAGKIVRVKGVVEELDKKLTVVVKDLKEQIQILDENGPEWLAAKLEIDKRPPPELPPISPPPAPSDLTRTIPRGAIKVLAWNVESGRSDLHMISRQLADFRDAHVFGLSEVDPLDFELYQKAIDDMDQRLFKSVTGVTGNDVRLQMVYDTERLELLETTEPDEMAGSLVNDGNHRSPLICLFRDKLTSSKFFTVFVHQARGKEDLRNSQSKGLREWSRDKSIAVVAMGDFNFDVDLVSLKGNASFDALRLDNILSWVQPETLVESNWTDTNKDLRNDYPNSILDGFFVAGPAKDWQPKSRIIVRPGDFPDDESTSDHRPVELTFVPR